MNAQPLTQAERLRNRLAFAKHVHAEAHAVVALQDIRRLLDLDATRAQVYRHIDAEITKRCQRCNLPPDLIGDA